MCHVTKDTPTQKGKEEMETPTHPITPIRKLIAVFTLALAVFTGTTVAAPEQASAHGTGHTDCIANWQTGWWKKTAYARNQCGHTINIKYQVDYGRDGKCISVPDGHALVKDLGVLGSSNVRGIPC